MSQSGSRRARIPVLLDTDIGGDIDDANALAFLIASPEIELVAVTTVGAGGSARQRAEVAAHLLEVGGHGDVDVGAGLDQPMLDNPVLRRVPGARILNAHESSMASARVSAVSAVTLILAAAERHGRDLVVLAIGCLTNIATAVQRAPETMRQVGRVVIMAGAYQEQTREANVVIDPEAADIVFRSGLPLQVLGLEVARQVQLPLTVYADRPVASSRIGQSLTRMASRYAAAYSTDVMTLYDVMAAVAVTHPDLFQFEDLQVGVELRGSYTRGMTVTATDEDLNAVPGASVISVACGVESAAVEALFRERVLAGTWP